MAKSRIGSSSGIGGILAQAHSERARQGAEQAGYAPRFRAYGERQYLTLGLETEGWNRKLAEEELANVMADVRRGIWTPPTRRPRRTGEAETADAMPTFGSFARSLMAARKGEMSEANYACKENALAHNRNLATFRDFKSWS